MKEICTEVEIQAPAERIWAHLADFPRFPRWNPFIRWVSGKARTGEQLEVHLQQSGTRGMTFRPTVLKAEPHREIRWRGRRGLLGLFEGEHVFCIEPLGPERARFVQRETLTGALVPLFGRTLDRDTRRGFEEMNDALKRLVEDERPRAHARQGPAPFAASRLSGNQGDHPAASELQEESRTMSREPGDPERTGASLDRLGNVAWNWGEYGAARTLYEESLAIRRQLGDQQGMASNLEGLAAVASVQGQPSRAARLFGAAEALREALGAPLPLAVRAEYDPKIAAVLAALDEAPFAAAWAAGRAMSLEQAVRVALEEDEIPTSLLVEERDRLRGASPTATEPPEPDRNRVVPGEPGK